MHFIKNIVISLSLTLVIFSASAQDVHFSQYNATPLLLNPALTGLSGYGYRFGANFRTQWWTLSTGNTYRTTSVFADFALGKPTSYSNFGGLGIMFYADQAGDLNYTQNKLDVSFSYHFMLNKRGTSSLSFGLQAGMGHRGLDQSNAVFDGDIDGNPNTGGEVLDRNPIFYGDASAGLVWSTSPKRNTNYYLGLALQHLNQPNISSFQDQTESERLYMKATIHGGGLIPVNNHVGIMPSFMILKQGPSQEYNISAYLKIKPSSIPSNTTAFYIGAMYRVLDAAIIAVRADVKGFNIGFSYDFTVSGLTPATNGNGGPEISLVYNGLFKKSNQVRYCPAL